ncbi:hypothetical protein EYF80_009305 [Liparis tanakae]|uniref:Uncharacterized protein n=1 Tax=Liparis tanakae TaxID=230148 RepID=A0A4Z2IRR1_9TELE|nr:hypothetical protein EYF80_009305 [Liparis tanakae]
MGGLAGQAISPEHGEAGTGLCGASAVLSDTLVDSLVILADAIYRQCAVRREEEESWKCKPHFFLYKDISQGSRICPFFSQVSWGSGSPSAWQVKTALVPTGRAMDCGA